MTETHSLLIDKTDGVGTITLNRPDKFNALNDELISKLKEALKEMDKDSKVKVVVITGAGAGFCSGQDLQDNLLTRSSQQHPSLGNAVRHHYNPLVLKIRRMEKPVIAAVNGAAVGAGASLALMCDFRVASEDAYFVQAFSKIGLIPDSGSTFLLPRLIGVAKAFELMLLAEKVSAAEALKLGMINKLVPQDQLLQESAALAKRLAEGATLAFGLTKRAVNRAIFPDLEELLEYEASLQEIAGQSEDFLEGIRAFREKRQPISKGR
jgi:2-(1,2-epoxy-1,2-dihydrophenyl)acetyl-CoA isomerase